MALTHFVMIGLTEIDSRGSTYVCQHITIRSFTAFVYV